jgi:hypothetical protein
MCTHEGHFFPFGIEREPGVLGSIFSDFGDPPMFSMALFTCSSSSQCVAQDIPNNTTLYPICFAQSGSFITYKGWPKRSSSILQFGGVSNVSIVLGGGPIKVAPCGKKIFGFTCPN